LSFRPQLLTLEDRVLPGEAVLGLLTMSLWAGGLAPAAALGAEATGGAPTETSGAERASLPAADGATRGAPDRPVLAAASFAADPHAADRSASSPSPQPLGDSSYRASGAGRDDVFAVLPFLGLSANAGHSPRRDLSLSDSPAPSHPAPAALSFSSGAPTPPQYTLPATAGSPAVLSGPRPSAALLAGAGQQQQRLSVRPLPAQPGAHPFVPATRSVAVPVEHLLPHGGPGVPGVTGSDSGTAIALDSAGDSYITGSLWNGTDTDVFVAKVDPSGNVLFVTVLANPGPDSGNGIALDALGNAYVTGSIANPDGTTSAFLAQFDPNGNLLILNVLPGGGADSGNGIAVQPDGSGYVTGATWNGTDTDFFIARFDPFVNVQAEFVYPNPGTDSGNAVAIDGGGNAYVTGTFAFLGDNYLYLAEFDAGTNLLNGNYIFNSGPNSGNGIAVQPDGSGYVTGTWWNGTDSDFLIARFNPDLSFPAMFVYPNPGTDSGNAVAIDGAGNAYVTGTFAFLGDNYVYFAEFDSGTNLLNGGYIFNSGPNSGNGIALDSSGNAWIAGASFNGAYTDALVAEFDPTTFNPVSQTIIPNGN
jgi:hypothetical protein